MQYVHSLYSRLRLAVPQSSASVAAAVAAVEPVVVEPAADSIVHSTRRRICPHWRVPVPVRPPALPPDSAVETVCLGVVVRLCLDRVAALGILHTVRFVPVLDQEDLDRYRVSGKHSVDRQVLGRGHRGGRKLAAAAAVVVVAVRIFVAVVAVDQGMDGSVENSPVLVPVPVCTVVGCTLRVAAIGIGVHSSCQV